MCSFSTGDGVGIPRMEACYYRFFNRNLFDTVMVILDEKNPDKITYDNRIPFVYLGIHNRFQRLLEIFSDADVVMFVYRPEYYSIPEFEDGPSTHNMCEVIIGKQRNGPTGNFRLTFLKEFGKFGDPDLFHETSVVSPAEF